MSEQVGEIYYTVDFDVDAMTRKTKTAEQNLDKLDNSFDKADRSAGKLNTGLTKLASAIGAVIAASALRDMAQMVQSYQEMAERVQMATSSQAEFESVQKRLTATANGTYRSLAEAQELYIRTADSLRSMGYTTQQALDVTDSMSYAFVKNATSADRANSAITAVSKALNTGKVSADQYESITVALPSIIDDIATASGKSAAQVRALGAAGKLTAQDLSEGLRKSLDENAKAAENMANNLTDAGVRSRNALTLVLVALEQQTGALDTFTNGIIAAADMVTEFAGDSDKMAAGLVALEVAATSLAAVVAGRMVMSLAAGAQGFYAATVAATAKARADVAAAQAAATLAAQELIAARAAEQAAVGLSTHAAAAARLTAAQTAATAATTALGNAQRVMAGTATLATRAVGLLRGAYALIGGPAGVALLAATAIYTFFTRAREAKAPTDDLTKSVKELTSAQRELATLETTRKLEELAEKAYQLGENLKYAQEQTGGAGRRSQRYAEDALRMRVEQEKLNEEIATYRKRLDDLNNYKGPTVSTGEDTPNLNPPADPAAEKAAQRAVDAIKDRVAALKLEADTLGMTETELELYKLQLAGATDEQIRAAATSLGLIDAYEMQTKAAEESAEAEKRRKEELQAKLMQADPQAAAQINYEKQLADLRMLNEAKLIEDERYLQLRAELEATYDEQRMVMEEEAFMRQSTANQLLIESLDAMGQASTQALSGLLSGASNGQEAMRALANTILNTVIGTFVQMGTEWVKQQIIQRAATQATIATQQAGITAVAATQAAATGTMAATTTATAAATGTAVTASMAPAAAVSSVASFGGAAVAGIAALLATMAIAKGISGRQQGGPVGVGKMYRINESGAPEVFNAANGRQFMLPNTRGEVVSNRDATKGQGGGAGGGVSVIVHNNASGANATASSRETDEGTIIDVVVENIMQGGQIGQAVNQVTGTARVGA